MGHSEDSEDSADWLMKEVAKAAAEPDEAPLRHPVPGDRVGNARQYEIRQLLGQGGMGTVLLAYDSVLDRRVALKFLRPGTGLSLDALLAQLQGEGQATARADHENIVRIFGKDEWDDGTHRIPFLIMEFLEGESLSSLLKRQRPDLRRALALMEGIAAGLAHAHQAGVIHLDLKPGNVFITRRGQVKLLDFGIARLTQGPGARPLDGFYCPGTKPYMAPEQLRDEALTPAADLWAAGVILFELIAGEHPFADANAFLLVERVLSDEPPPSIRERRPDVPEGVERLLSALLAKAPDRRIQNGGELLEELRELRERLWGRAAATRATGSERRQVTLVSCLLAGRPSEDGGEGAVLDGQSEDFHDLERAFQDLCARAFRRRGGTLYTRVGDEVVAVFGYPRAQEDDTAGASRAALEVAAAVQRELAPRYPGRLAVKIGLEAALVCLAETADGTLAVQGEGPKIAQWIARQAGLDEVVLGPAAQALVRGAFSFQELEGRRVFEGLGGTLTLRL
ncbi:MAG TPA: protein kinase, partial [Longimicrobium sp.]|nr:protein kinase [Longimicrobium sp.]